MMRNIGGSVGIAIAATLIARRQQYHQSVLVEHITPYTTQYSETIQSLQQTYLPHHATAADALQQAQALLYVIVQKEASVLSFLDCFWVMGVVLAALVPLVF